jgi:hypothetical protein
MLLMAETLATILDGDGPAGLVEHLEQLGPPAEQAAVLDDLWRARTPHLAAVLEATGKAHPNAKVAKAARKAAFKLAPRESPIANATQGESPLLDSPEYVCAGQARFEYPATSVPFSKTSCCQIM